MYIKAKKERRLFLEYKIKEHYWNHSPGRRLSTKLLKVVKGVYLGPLIY